MKTTLFMAITVNGFIADPHDDTEWIKDTELLYQTIADFGIAVMGKRTYDEAMKFNVFPYAKALNVVMTHDQKLLEKNSEKVHFTADNPQAVLAWVESQGFTQALIIGGGHVNGAFMAVGLIDELIVDIHPMLIAEGIELFESEFPYQNLELVSFKEMNDQILQVRYKVKKS